uniref:ABC transporter domain-containing protein n=2 Tax=Rhodosorus marinus TaxID=101924 RepID=A0A7S2ZJA7_9RHOD|mmetsp:Transcript_21439/g.87546  ORF Transcript_21439/g.87546 Transcript_21439/m.87546 type:complete len:264 (+) Transcript_21439:833-1624(+)
MFGYVHQDAGVDKILTGREHLELFADLAHVDTARKEQNIEDLITALRMENFVDLETGVYSGGIKRRLDIALAMVHQPGLLLLDEPTTGLDVESRAIIWDLLREFRENGGCVLLTSHYLEEVDTLADVVGIMDKGSLIASGTTAELKESLGGTRVQIRIEEFTSQTEAERALEHLKSKGAIRQGLINPGMGNALELVVPANRDTSDTVEILLRDAGFDSMFSVSKSRMSLGDVYLTATGRSLQDADLIAQAARDPKQTKKEQIL